ncbi:MAG: hypothetical protein K2M17_03960 [Bacilli bacterium]|nr:hypothetical protein [Bacilli bacterium]
MKIFVLAGKAGSGKGEVARMIKEYYIYKLQNSVITEYCKYLKLFAKEMTDWDGISENKPRDFLQQFGSKIRAYDKNFFTKRMIEDVNIYAAGDIQNVIIADARMPEEIEKIKLNFDEMYEVYSIYIVNQFAPSKLTIEQQAHITETALENYDEFDYTIANDELGSLKDKVFKYLEGIEENEK